MNTTRDAVRQSAEGESTVDGAPGGGATRPAGSTETRTRPGIGVGVPAGTGVEVAAVDEPVSALALARRGGPVDD
jgi:hypothetical protein